MEAITQLRFPVPGCISLTTELIRAGGVELEEEMGENLIVSWIGKCMGKRHQWPGQGVPRDLYR